MIFDDFPNKVVVSAIPNGLVFSWSRTGVGFGQLSLCVKDGKLVVDDECMSEKFNLGIIEQAFQERMTFPEAYPNACRNKKAINEKETQNSRWLPSATTD